MPLYTGSVDNSTSANKDMQLWNKYRQGNTAAKWELLDNMRGIITSQARKLSNVRPYSVVEAELKELALNAFDTYSPQRGTKLSTHVMNSFKKVSRGNISNQHAIRIPENIHFKYKPYMEAKNYLTDALNRDPTNQEISEYTGWALPKVMDASRRFRSELVESKQTYDPVRYEDDPTQHALFYAYNSLDNTGKYILEHTTAYGGKSEMKDGDIRRKLRMTPYTYNKKKNEVISVVRGAIDVANLDT